MKFIIYSIIAVLAIVSAVIAFRLSEQAAPTASVAVAPTSEINVKTVDVLVARVNVPVGSIIDSSMIDRQPWPENLVLDSFIVNDGQENILGKVVRSAIQAHEPFIKSKLANPNDPGFLAANLPAGMRAVTIATDTVSGVAGFVFPGDRVDLLFTHEPIPASSTPNGKPTFTELLGSNIRVLAINVRDGGDSSRPSVVSPSSITIEVSDALAQQVRLAEKNGTLSFSLRSIRDDNLNNTNPTAVGDLSKASTLSTAMSIVRGPGSAGGKMNYEDLSATGRSVEGNSPDADAAVVHPGSNVQPGTPAAMGGAMNNNSNATNGQNNVK